MALPVQYPQSPGLRLSVDKCSAARTIDVAHGGSTFMVTDPGAAGYTITLPKLSEAGPGWHCKFVNAKTGGTMGQLIVITANTDDDGSKLCGLSLDGDANSATTATNATATSIRFAAASTAGDSIEIYTDGVFWYGYGQSTKDGGVVFA